MFGTFQPAATLLALALSLAPGFAVSQSLAALSNAEA